MRNITQTTLEHKQPLHNCISFFISMKLQSLSRMGRGCLLMEVMQSGFCKKISCYISDAAREKGLWFRQRWFHQQSCQKKKFNECGGLQLLKIGTAGSWFWARGASIVCVEDQGWKSRVFLSILYGNPVDQRMRIVFHPRWTRYCDG